MCWFVSLRMGIFNAIEFAPVLPELGHRWNPMSSHEDSESTDLGGHLVSCP